MQKESNMCETLAGLGALAVDLQPVFVDLVNEPENLRANCEFFIHSVVLFELPLFFTEQVPDKLGNTEETIRKLAPSAPVYAKDTFSTFGASGFPEALDKAGVEHLLLAGVETSVCVYLTALEALSAGKEVTILTDCVSCRRPEDGEWALRKLAAAGCHLLPAESVFYGILGGARHPYFRAFTKLVRERDLK